MHRSMRLNMKLVLAAICFIAGTVILWRTFVSPPEPALDLPEAATSAPAIVIDETPLPTQALAVLEPSPTSEATQPPPPTLPPATATLPPIPTAAPPTLPPATATLPPPTLPPATRPNAPQPTTPPLTATPRIPTPTVTPSVTLTPSFTASATTPPTAVPPTVIVPTATSATANGTPTPTASATASPTLTPTSLAQGLVRVVYRVEGAASRVVIRYLDATGVMRTAEEGLPWSYEFAALPDADLQVESYSANNEEVALSCAIDVDGTTIVIDRTDDSAAGVLCERYAN